MFAVASELPMVTIMINYDMTLLPHISSHFPILEPGLIASSGIIPISISSCASAQAVFASACTENCPLRCAKAEAKASIKGTSRLARWLGEPAKMRQNLRKKRGI